MTVTTAAATANPVSTGLTPRAGDGAERDGAGPRGAAVGAGRGAEDTAGAGDGAGAAGAVPAAGAAGAGVAAATADGDGILIVGAAVGFGGKLIRTVSFLGCTLVGSAARGGTAPEGGFGVGVFCGLFSAIGFCSAQPRFRAAECQMKNAAGLALRARPALTLRYPIPPTTGVRGDLQNGRHPDHREDRYSTGTDALHEDERYSP